MIREGARLLLLAVVASVCLGSASAQSARRATAGGAETVSPKAAELLSEVDIVHGIYADLNSIHECHRPFVRYFVFRHFYPPAEEGRFLLARAGSSELCMHALNKALNSLSWAPVPFVYPVSKLDGAMFLRFDLRFAGWDTATWDRIVRDYPYAVQIDDAQAKWVRKVTQCDVPYVRGDWFVYSCCRPPLYHDVLGIPKDQVSLEKMLRVNVEDNIQLGRVVRSGFHKSQVSRNNRLVEFHRTAYGALWKSYDFATNAGRKDFFAHPTGPAWESDERAFQHDGGELIFNLPNGLQAYMLVNAKGERIDKAPINIVSDNTARDPQIINGVSCMGCHTEGIKAVPADEVRPHVEAARMAYANEEVASIRALHPEGKVMDVQVNVTKRVYDLALQTLGQKDLFADPVRQLSGLYESEVELATAAAEVGLKPDQFKARLNGSSNELKRELSALQNEKGRVHRAVFVQAYPRLVEEWGVGVYQPPGGYAPAEVVPPVPTALALPPADSYAENASLPPANPSDRFWVYGGIAGGIFLFILATAVVLYRADKRENQAMAVSGRR